MMASVMHMAVVQGNWESGPWTATTYFLFQFDQQSGCQQNLTYVLA